MKPFTVKRRRCLPQVTYKLSSIRDLHLYRPALHISARLERAHGLLDRKPMRDQPPHVAQHARLDEPNRARPRIRVPIQEPNVHLPRRHPHKRERNLALPNPDHEHRPPEPHRLDRSPDRRLRARAFERYVWLCAPAPPHCVYDPRCESLFGLFGRYE